MIERVCVFDIETAPNPQLIALALSCARERAARRGEDSAEIDESAVVAEMALSPLFGRVVAVGLLDADFPDEPLIAVGADEAELLHKFWHWAAGFDLYVGYRSMSFDVPFLELRSRILGVDIAVEISQRRYCWHNHIDVYEILTAWRGNRTRHLRLDLATVCCVLGVEPPVGDGAEVPTLVENGDWDAIKRHLESDLRATLGIWRALGCPGAPSFAVELEKEVPF